MKMKMVPYLIKQIKTEGNFKQKKLKSEENSFIQLD